MIPFVTKGLLCTQQFPKFMHGKYSIQGETPPSSAMYTLKMANLEEPLFQVVQVQAKTRPLSSGTAGPYGAEEV
jgi:hypothetical protein